MPTATSATDRIGQVLDAKYELRAVVGTGGMGTVYEAVNVSTGRPVAVKVMHASVITPQNVARFLKEWRALIGIRHTGIVEVFDEGRAPDGVPYLVMELLRGEDLFRAMNRGRVSAGRLVEIMIDLLDALGAAHDAGFVHRDIKPENVFLVGEINQPAFGVKLLDFGVARELHPHDGPSITRTGTVIGTPYYMSPEQARGGSIDARADLWSVGAVLFHALTGRPPYVGQNHNVVVAAIVYTDPPMLSNLRRDVPPALALVVDRALARDVSRRWQTAREMRRALIDARAEVMAWTALATAGAQQPTLERLPTSVASKIHRRQP